MVFFNRKDSSHSETSDSDSILGAKHSLENQFKELRLNDLDVVGTLGIGGFGRVELVSLCCYFRSFRVEYSVKRCYLNSCFRLFRILSSLNYGL